MDKLSRREFVVTASAAALAGAASPSFAAPAPGAQRVFVGSGTPDGILAFDWHSATGELTPAGVAAKISTVDWITFSPGREFMYAAAEVDSFNGKPTGEVASFSVSGGKLAPLSAQNSASPGTCHVALDQTGRVLLSADYGGGAAAPVTLCQGRREMRRQI